MLLFPRVLETLRRPAAHSQLWITRAVGTTRIHLSRGYLPTLSNKIGSHGGSRPFLWLPSRGLVFTSKQCPPKPIFGIEPNPHPYEGRTPPFVFYWRYLGLIPHRESNSNGILTTDAGYHYIIRERLGVARSYPMWPLKLIAALNSLF